jgi:hypothetical protein
MSVESKYFVAEMNILELNLIRKIYQPVEKVWNSGENQT